MKDAGFVDVSVRVLHIPIGEWPKDRVLKQVGRCWKRILSDGAEAIALGALTRGLGWERERVGELVESVAGGLCGCGCGCGGKVSYAALCCLWAEACAIGTKQEHWMESMGEKHERNSISKGLLEKKHEKISMKHLKGSLGREALKGILGREALEEKDWKGRIGFTVGFDSRSVFGFWHG